MLTEKAVLHRMRKVLKVIIAPGREGVCCGDTDEQVRFQTKLERRLSEMIQWFWSI